MKKLVFLLYPKIRLWKHNQEKSRKCQLSTAAKYYKYGRHLQAKHSTETLTTPGYIHPVGYFLSYAEQTSVNLMNLLKLKNLSSF